MDLTGAKQNTGVWLVKVPKYLSQQWAKASGRGEVGKIRICKKGNMGKPEVTFTLNEELTVIDGIDAVSAPREHPFTMQTVGGQTLAVFTETSSGQSEERSDNSSLGSGAGPDKIALEGMVVQRAECRPAVSESYMRLKRLQIEESSKPARVSQQLQKAVTSNYKPVANHANNVRKWAFDCTVLFKCILNREVCYYLYNISFKLWCQKL